MSGVVALCHFCELHGPSVIFCTQAFHDGSEAYQEFISAATAAASASASGDDEGNSSSSSTIVQRDPSELSPAAAASSPSLSNEPSNDFGADARGVQWDASTASLPSPARDGDGAGGSGRSERSASCPSCTTLRENERGFVTHEEETKTTFLSTRAPANRQVYAMVRQACVRSLSCEFAPGREGPLLFGDDASGYALSYMFKLKDSQARGMLRWYCFTLLMLDRIFLVASWPFIVSNFRIIVADMQARAARTHSNDLLAKKRQDSSRVFGRGQISRSSSSADTFLRRAGGLTTPRALTDIVGAPDYLAHIHACTSWLLKACARRLFERQYSSVLLEAAPESKPQQAESPADETLGGPIGSPPASASEELPPTESLAGTPLYDSSPPVAIESFLQVARLLRPESVNALVYNVTVGNQIIVRGASALLVGSVLRALQTLLPPGCATSLPYEAIYHDTWQCNFLGLHAGVAIPAHVDKGSYALVDIRYDSTAAAVAESDGASPSAASGLEARFRSFSFAVNAQSSRPRAQSLSTRGAQLPAALGGNDRWNTYTLQIESLLSLDRSDRMLQMEVSALREEWMTKARTLFMVLRTGSAAGDTEENLRRFLKVFSLREADLVMLRFWMTGISKAQRAKLLGLSGQQQA